MSGPLGGVCDKLGRNGGLTGQIYAQMVTKLAVPAFKLLYGSRAVKQDDPAKIHRAIEALKACEAFSVRIPPDCQAPKMTDVWPIGNVWAIVKQRAKMECVSSKAELRKVIIKIGKRLTKIRTCTRDWCTLFQRGSRQLLVLTEGKSPRKTVIGYAINLTNL